MAWFKKERGVETNKLHNFLSSAFQKVKQDTSTLFSWINYFHNKHQEHDSRFAEIERQIYYMPKTRDEIKHIIDSHYSLDPIKDRISALRERVEDLEKVRVEPQERIMEKPVERIIETHPAGLQKSERFLREPAEIREIIHERAPRARIRDKLVRKIVKNSKDYLKSVIFAVIRRYGEISASNLKEMIVEEQGLCSKSSFYRLLTELEKEEEFAVITKGKEKVYLLKSERYINK